MGNQIPSCCGTAADLPDEVVEVPPSKVDEDARREEPKNALKVEEVAKPVQAEATPTPAPSTSNGVSEKDPVGNYQPQERPNLAPPSEVPPSEQTNKQPELKMMDQMWQKYREGAMSTKEKDFFAHKFTSVGARPSTRGIGLQDYAGKHSDVFNEVKSLIASDGWVLKKSVDSVDIFTKSVPEKDLLATKGITTMKTCGNGIRHLVAYMLTAEDRPEYDEICGYGKTVESCLPHYRILHLQMKSPTTLIAPRDILTLSRIQFEEDGTLVIATTSTEHPEVPENPPHVRVQLVGGYTIKPTKDPDVYEVTFCVSADPGGWLPGWVKNLIAWKSQLVLAHFKKFYEGAHSKSQA